MEQAYFVSVLYKLDAFVYIGLILSLSALIVSLVMYAIGSDDDSLKLSCLASDVHEIEHRSKSISESCEHIENVLNQNSVLSDEEKNRLERLLDQIDVHLFFIEESISGVDKIVNETKSKGGVGKSILQGLAILTAILLTLHIFLPSKDFIDKMVGSNERTVNTPISCHGHRRAPLSSPVVTIADERGLIV